MKVLVTGHEGYLGSVIVPHLAAAGHEVVGLDTGLFADCTLGPAPAEVPTLRLDLRDVTSDHITQVRPDAVIHLAALCNDPLGNLDPDLTYGVNYRATLRLARAAKAAGVARFLFSSSCSLYGSGVDDSPLDESAAFAPLTPYGDSKILSEQGLAHLVDDGFSAVFLRNATAYGFSPRLRGDLVVNDLVATRTARRRSASAQRRLGVAAAHPRRGHRRGVPRAYGGAARGDSRPRVQCRPDQ